MSGDFASEHDKSIDPPHELPSGVRTELSASSQESHLDEDQGLTDHAIHRGVEAMTDQSLEATGKYLSGLATIHHNVDQRAAHANADMLLSSTYRVDTNSGQSSIEQPQEDRVLDARPAPNNDHAEVDLARQREKIEDGIKESSGGWGAENSNVRESISKMVVGDKNTKVSTRRTAWGNHFNPSSNTDTVAQTDHEVVVENQNSESIGDPKVEEEVDAAANAVEYFTDHPEGGRLNTDRMQATPEVAQNEHVDSLPVLNTSETVGPGNDIGRPIGSFGGEAEDYGAQDEATGGVRSREEVKTEGQDSGHPAEGETHDLPADLASHDSPQAQNAEVTEDASKEVDLNHENKIPTYPTIAAMVEEKVVKPPHLDNDFGEQDVAVTDKATEGMAPVISVGSPSSNDAVMDATVPNFNEDTTDDSTANIPIQTQPVEEPQNLQVQLPPVPGDEQQDAEHAPGTPRIVEQKAGGWRSWLSGIRNSNSNSQ